MLLASPRLEDFPDSPYTHELRRGVANLRFAAPLEREYEISHMRWARLRVRIWFSVGSALAIATSALEMMHGELGIPLGIAEAIYIVLGLALVCLVWSRYYERYFMSVAPLLVPGTTVFVSVFIALSFVQRHQAELADQAINVVAIFFFSGLLYRRVLLTAALTIVSFEVTAIIGGLPMSLVLLTSANMIVTAIIGAIVCRESEQAHRRNFLESAMISEMVDRDGLSGLMNRRAFDQHLARVWQLGLRDQRSVAVLMIDIDHFKRYNENFGHQGGDAALRRVAQTVQEFTRRPLDMAARYGGEEFAAIFYDLALPHVQDMAERLRERVQNLEMRARDAAAPADPDVTVSMGVAVVTPALGRSAEGLVQLADEALYEAKEGGRNRVVVSAAQDYEGLSTGVFKLPKDRLRNIRVMFAARPRVEESPISPYAREVDRGIGKLRFAEPLETQFRVAHLRWARLRVRTWFTWTCLLAVVFASLQLWSAGLAHPLSVAKLVHVPVAFVLLWLAWSRRYERNYLAVAQVLVPILNALVASFSAVAYAAGHHDLLAGEALNLVAIFFFCGLLFRQAVVTATITVVSFQITAIMVGLPTDGMVDCLVNMTLPCVMGAIVCRDSEQSHRRNFLEAALIGDLVARDGLSGLMNRRAFDEHLARVWQHALRDQRSIAVLMIDIDHFKRYNDEFGHQAGDEALRRVAQTVQQFTQRPLDLAARYGGEEFVAILYDLSLPHVQDTAERLRECVQNLVVRPADAERRPKPDVTISVGVACATPTLGRTAAGIVQLADEALYEAKAAGRNLIVVKSAAAYRGLDTGAFKAAQHRRKA
ncbi:MAG: diguanylate cyclase [Pseudomonadota bacterium]|nr:diguanylate cyclase [Pseudomonadota bacterium]